MEGKVQAESARIKAAFSLAISEMRYGRGCQESNPVFVELQEAGMELRAGTEKHFHFEWNIRDVDECHIYITNKLNGHRYHVSVVSPAALYVDVYRIQDDGTEHDAFAENG